MSDFCTKFDFGWGSAPDPAGELTVLPRPLAGFKGPTSLPACLLLTHVALCQRVIARTRYINVLTYLLTYISSTIGWLCKFWSWLGFRPTFLKCTKFDQLILRKIIKIVATRCQILWLKCTKFDFGWGSAPDRPRPRLQHSPRPLAGFKGAYL